MLHILLLTLLFLFCKAINYANITHLTLALLPVLAAVNIIDDSPIPFLNHIIISLTSLMIADLVSKTNLNISQPHNTTTESLNTKTVMNEPQTAESGFRNAQNMETPPTTTTSANHTSLPRLNTTLKPHLATATPLHPTNSTKAQTSDPNPTTAADRVASLKKSLNAHTPVKPVRETDPDSPFYVYVRERMRRRSRAQ